MLDNSLVRSLAELVADVLADERLRNDGGPVAPNASEELELARNTVRAELARLSAKRPYDAWPPLDEEALISEVIARVLGLGGLESLLADPDVSDIHVRGSDSVWVKLRDGRREPRAPIVESDDELVSLIRRAATRFSRTRSVSMQALPN